jgi:FkbM family methyltransferase
MENGQRRLRNFMLNSFSYLRRVVEKTLSIGDVRTIVEIGANKCTESVAFAETYAAADVYSFECNPETIPVCKKTIGSQPRIHLIEKAVSDADGFLDFYPIDTQKAVTPHEDGNPGASSLFKRNQHAKGIAETLPQKKITVESVTLKKFMRDTALTEIDILWLDAQGAELMILKGLASDISKVKIIQCEVEFTEEYEGQPLYAEIRAFLEKNDFAFSGFSDEWYPHAADALFIRRDIVSKAPFGTRIFLRLSAILPVKPLWARRITWRLRQIYAKKKYNPL